MKDWDQYPDRHPYAANVHQSSNLWGLNFGRRQADGGARSDQAGLPRPRKVPVQQYRVGTLPHSDAMRRTALSRKASGLDRGSWSEAPAEPAGLDANSLWQHQRRKTRSCTAAPALLIEGPHLHAQLVPCSVSSGLISFTTRSGPTGSRFNAEPDSFSALPFKFHAIQG